MRNKGLNYILIILLIFFIPTFFSLTTLADDRPILLVGDDEYYPPYSYVNEEGEAVGFNIDLIKSVANALGYDVEIRLDEWSETRKALEKGDIDLISGMVYSKEREEFYSLSLKHSV